MSENLKMPSIMQSIKPQYCELIASGKKTIEVRKTKPKIPTPFKVYIYQTKHSWIYNIYSKIADWQGKVIGEYVCNKIDKMSHCGNCSNDIKLRLLDKYFCAKDLDWEYLNNCRLSYADLVEYSNSGNIYGWHISDLKIYDKPKELSEFYVVDNEAVKQCEYRNKCYINPYLTNGGWLNGTYSCSYNGEHEFCTKCKVKPLTRPPQSWCYIEEV